MMGAIAVGGGAGQAEVKPLEKKAPAFLHVFRIGDVFFVQGVDICGMCICYE